MKIMDLMKRAPTTVRVDDDLSTARDLMVWMGIRHLPVMRGTELVGILSEHDVAAYLSRTGEGPRGASGHAVERIMHSPVETATPDEPVGQAAERMARHKIGCLPVVDRGALVGIVTSTDILANQVRRAPEPAPDSGPTVAEAMSRNVQTVHAGDHLLDAAARMQSYGIRHLPVVDGDGEILGMLSDRDVRAAVGNPKRVAGGREAEIQLELLQVRDAMSAPAITVREDERCVDVAHYFADMNASAVPVVNEAGELVGICSYIDILRALSSSR